MRPEWPKRAQARLNQLKLITMKQLTYARKCDTCGSGMNEGYLIFWNEATYCSDECLHKEVNAKQYQKMYNEDEACYTDWSDDAPEYVEVDGVLQQL